MQCSAVQCSALQCTAVCKPCLEWYLEGQLQVNGPGRPDSDEELLLFLTHTQLLFYPALKPDAQLSTF